MTSDMPRIRIEDPSGLRPELSRLIENRGMLPLAMWARIVAERTASLFPDSDPVAEATVLCSEVVEGFTDGTMTVGEIRRRGSAVHALAKGCEGAEQAAVRTVGHALSVCHMREHAIVASDYAILTLNLLYPGDTDSMVEERTLQIRDLS